MIPDGRHEQLPAKDHANSLLDYLPPVVFLKKAATNAAIILGKEKGLEANWPVTL